MTLTLKFFSFLYVAMIVAFHCKADGYPPPTDLSFKWLDNFTVKVSWKKPRLKDGSEVRFLMKKASRRKNELITSGKCVAETNATDRVFTEDMGSNHSTYNVWTVDKDCHFPNDSTPASITIQPPKPRAVVMTDFKCLMYSEEMNCSWNPVNQTLNLTLHYRICGNPEKRLKKCYHYYKSGKRNGCSLPVNADRESVCILVDTEAGMSTFKAVLAVPSPKLSIEEEGDSLKLSLESPDVGKKCAFTYEICYKQCNMPEVCLNKSSGQLTMVVHYDKSCLYEFRARVGGSEICPEVSSDFSEVLTYGSDGTLTVVAIVIPIILSVCVILSCYCFRRHSAIICPIIPDPSTIFKEMMMNGNKEPKPAQGSLYTPVPEPIEPCKITLVTENGVLQQNS